MTTTAQDYTWLRTSVLLPHIRDLGYSLALVRGLAPVEVLRALGAEPRGVCTGTAGLRTPNDSPESEDGSFRTGVFAVPGTDGAWALVLHLEDFGAGLTEQVLTALSTGGRVVVHTSNGGKPIHTFEWYEDGELRTSFESPVYRDGRTPDALNPLMREVGFHLTHEEEPPEAADLHTEAAGFALAERLSGVRVTEELLQGAEYLLGRVPDFFPVDEDEPRACGPAFSEGQAPGTVPE